MKAKLAHICHFGYLYVKAPTLVTPLTESSHSGKDNTGTREHSNRCIGSNPMKEHRVSSEAGKNGCKFRFQQVGWTLVVLRN